MTVLSSVPAGDDFERQLAAAEPDMLRAMVKSFAEALMSAEADAACGAGYGQVSPERVNSRNGYRTRPWDTRVGSIELAVPKLRAGSYGPRALLQRRGRAVDQPHPRHGLVPDVDQVLDQLRLQQVGAVDDDVGDPVSGHPRRGQIPAGRAGPAGVEDRGVLAHCRQQIPAYRRAEEIFEHATRALANPGASKAELAELRGWALHQLRHFRLTHEAEAGTNTPTLLAISRHASVRCLERYARPGVDAVAAHVAATDPAARRRL